MKKRAPPSHGEQVVALKRIEGQVRGIRNMIEQKRYCVDILTQLSSVGGAVHRVQDKVLAGHLNGCVAKALTGSSKQDQQKKIQEILILLKKFRKNG